MLRLLALAALLGACSKKGPDCKVEAEALGKFLADTPHEPSPIYVQHGLTLVLRTDLPTNPIPEAPVVIVAPTRRPTRACRSIAASFCESTSASA